MSNFALHDLIKSQEQGTALSYAVMAAFMGSARSLERASLMLLITATLICLSGMLSAALAAASLVLHLLLALAATYYAWRVALDARLFDVLARHAEHGSAFDTALACCLGKESPVMRSSASRWHGAKRLLRYQIALVIMQGVAVIGTILAGLRAG